jgi:hypothetical protein
LCDILFFICWGLLYHRNGVFFVVPITNSTQSEVELANRNER